MLVVLGTPARIDADAAPSSLLERQFGREPVRVEEREDGGPTEAITGQLPELADTSRKASAEGGLLALQYIYDALPVGLQLAVLTRIALGDRSKQRRQESRLDPE